MQCRCALPELLLITVAAHAQDTVHVSVSEGVLSVSAHFSAAPPTLSGRLVAGAPYSAEETGTTVQTLADGAHITQVSTGKLYRDSAGRTRSERPLPGAAWAGGQSTLGAPILAMITDPVANAIYTLDTVGKVAHKQTIGAPEAQTPARRAPAAERAAACPVLNDCAREGPKIMVERLGSQSVEGLPAKGERRTTVIPAGFEGNDRPVTVVGENWVSPDLKVSVLAKKNDPRFGESTRKLANIDRREPDPSLFLPPADYKIVEEKGDFTIKWSSISGVFQ
jgi:hypothetical protein